MKNKRVKQMMVSVFSGEWETLATNIYKLVIIDGYFGCYPVSCALHGQISLTSNQLKGK